MHSLIFGGEGQVGPLLKSELQSRGITVSTFDLRNSPDQDVRSYESVRLAIEVNQPDLVFFLAAQAYVPESTSNPWRGSETITGGLINLFEACRQLGQRPKILVSGTSEEYGYNRTDSILTEESLCSPDTPYGVFKLSGSLLALTYMRNYNFQVTITRAWNHFGPGASSMYAIGSFSKKIALAEKFGSKVAHGDLTAVRDYTDARDVVRAYADLVLQGQVGIFNIASGKPRAIGEVLEMLVSISKADISFHPDASLGRLGVNQNFPAADTRKIHAAVGWEPKIDFRDSLLETLESWRQRVANH